MTVWNLLRNAKLCSKQDCHLSESKYNAGEIPPPLGAVHDLGCWLWLQLTPRDSVPGRGIKCS